MPGNEEMSSGRRLFSSRRERRLWIWTLTVVVAIYSTLGLARVFADTLGDSPIIGLWSFLLACLMVVAAVITQGLKVRPSGLEIVVAMGVTAVYLLVLVRMSIPTERSHLVEYGVVGVLFYEALLERVSNGRRVPVPALLALAGATLIGVIDECIQAILPSRVIDPFDMLFNFLAALMAIAASVSLRWARRMTFRLSHRQKGSTR